MPNNPSKPENSSTKPEMTSTKPEVTSTKPGTTPPTGSMGSTTIPGRVEKNREADKFGGKASSDSKRTDAAKPEQKPL